MKYQEMVQQPLPSASPMAGPMFMLSASFLFAVSHVLVKLFGPEYNAWHIAFYRFFGGMALMLVLSGRHRNPFSGHNTRLLLIRGSLGAINFIFVITAIRLLPVSTALVIFFTFPAFAAIYSYLIYHERINASQIMCIVGAVAGIGILMDFHASSNYIGYIMALAASAVAGMNVTLVRELRKSNGPVIIYLYLSTIGAALTLPNFIMHPLIPGSPLGWAMIMALIITAGTAQLLMNQGFYYCLGWEGGTLMISEAIFTVAAGILLLGDPLTWRFFIGGLMIFISSVMLNRFRAVANNVG
jgi:drug/metabolite transporter (DMT)-like permease